jgi:hypothetical protein
MSTWKLLLLGLIGASCLGTGWYIATGGRVHAPNLANAEGVQTAVKPLFVTIQLPPMFVDDASSLQYDVPVRNETDGTVRFTQIRQSCTCAGATKLAAMELAPGQTTTLHFDIDLRQRKGPQRFVCYLVEASGVEWTYTLETTLYERARFAADGIVHFGMVDPKAEEVRETQFYLHAESLQALPQVVAFWTESDKLRVESDLALTEQQADGTAVRKVPLKLRLRAAEVPGLAQTSVIAEIDRRGQKQQVRTGVTWNVRSFYSVAPPQVYFGTIDPTSTRPVERRVVIRRTDGQPLSLKQTKTSSTCVRCSIEKSENDSVGRLLMVLEPGSINGPLWGEVTVETDHPAQPQVTIPVAVLMQVSK